MKNTPIHIAVGLASWTIGLILWFAYFTFEEFIDETLRPFIIVMIIGLQCFTLFTIGYELKLRYDKWREKKRTERIANRSNRKL